MGPLQTVSEYAIQWIKKMQNENLRSWSPKQQITDQFNEHVQVCLSLDGSHLSNADLSPRAGMGQIHRMERQLPQLVQEQRNRSRQRRLPRLLEPLYEAARSAALRRL